jgi:hypothetical protein
VGAVAGFMLWTDKAVHERDLLGNNKLNSTFDSAQYVLTVPSYYSLLNTVF